ncbi:MAG: hypothetical protein N0C84_00870 [Candidatus Thiodiazotropha taylori]|uniref:Uncharacterized protein n=1 Tax=Candidatus Thiodiazotropha taylori TaxID=2792791 RepID=A0A9E4K9F7_9GAMM|nr:hypothetical protein [Candidatus Thiodiazotropha taylori]MCW4254997.1 hypothetical protein [Candidatus Thiodiazotropha taylori]
MIYYTKDFVDNSLPEFVQRDHPLFELFLLAYYEFLEKEKVADSEIVVNRKTLYENIPNPVGLVNNFEDYIDVDSTLEDFLQFFEYDVVEASLKNLSTDRRFLLKKIRDIYLSKGTPNSFKLFFRLFFNKEIEIFESKHSILRPSDGRYFKFAIGFFYVDDYRFDDNDIAVFDFTLSTLFDSEHADTGLEVILTGTPSGTTHDGKKIVTLMFSDDDVDLDRFREQNLWVEDPSDKSIRMAIKPMVTVTELSPSDSDNGSYYEVGNLITFNSHLNKKDFNISVEDTTYGSVETMKIRNRGVNYNINDAFLFYGEDATYGDGGYVRVTDVDKNGYMIDELDNFLVRTGHLNNGWLANVLEDAAVPISYGGKWKKLPSYKYTSNQKTYVTDGGPYWEPHLEGTGAELQPISDSIGQISGLTMNEVPYFMDSDDASITVPYNVVVENNYNLEVGHVVTFQEFDPDEDLDPGIPFHALAEDSEYFTYSVGVTRQFLAKDLDSDGNLDPDTGHETFTYKGVTYTDKYIHYFDSDINPTSSYNVQIPYGYDSDDFKWKVINVEMNVNNTPATDKDIGVNDEFIAAVNELKSLASSWVDEPDGKSGTIDMKEFYITWSLTDSDFIHDVNHEDFGEGTNHDFVLDGGDSENFSSQRDSLFWDTYEYNGEDYQVGRRVRSVLKLKYHGWWVNQLEDYHIQQLEYATIDSEFRYRGFDVTTLPHLLPWLDTLRGTIEIRDWGQWYDLLDSDDKPFKGIITNINEFNGVVQMCPLEDHQLPTKERLDYESRPKHKVIRLSIFSDSDANNFNLPLKNVVHDIQHATVNYKIGVVQADIYKFYTTDGWLSTSYGANLHDNWMYDDYAYSIKTDLHVGAWLERFKQMLHPAGMVLTALYNQDMPADVDNTEALPSEQQTVDQTTMTFDNTLDYVTPADFDNLTAGHIYYTVNAFEIQNSPGTPVRADNFDYEISSTTVQQTGNSWWDYEPIGLISEGSSQVDTDSDGLVDEYAVKKYVKYNAEQSSFYKKPSRNTLHETTVSITDFRNVMSMFADTVNPYTTFTSANAASEFIAFDDSEQKQFDYIDYTKLKANGINVPDELLNQQTPRKREVLMRKHYEFSLAMREEKKLTFGTLENTYYDHEAYDIKWNTINDLRTINTEGWQLQDYAREYVGYKNFRRYDYRGPLMNDKRPKEFITKKAPEMAYDNIVRDNYVWHENYSSTGINRVPQMPELDEFSPKELMNGRRKGK